MSDDEDVSFLGTYTRSDALPARRPDLPPVCSPRTDSQEHSPSSRAAQAFDAIRRVLNVGSPHEGPEEGTPLKSSAQCAATVKWNEAKEDLSLKWSHIFICKESVRWQHTGRASGVPCTSDEFLNGVVRAAQGTLSKNLTTPEDVHQCLRTVLMCYMLGAEVDFACIHAILLTAERAPYHKRFGYLVSSMLLPPGDQRHLLLVNNILKDLRSEDVMIASIALRATSKVITEETYPVVIEQVVACLSSPDPVLYKNSIIALHALYLLVGKHVLAIQFKSPGEMILFVLGKMTVSTMLPTLNFCRALAEKEDFTASPAPRHSSLLSDILESITGLLEDMAHHCNRFSDTNKPSIFVQVLALRLAAAFAAKCWETTTQPFTKRLAAALKGMLNKARFGGARDAAFAASPPAMTQGGMAVIYEVVRSLANALAPVYWDKESQPLRTAASECVAAMLGEEGCDAQYVAMKCCAHLSRLDQEEAVKHQQAIVKAVASSDVSMLLAGVDVLCAMARPRNVKRILSRLVLYARRPPKRVGTMGTCLVLRSAVVERLYELSWRIARVARPRIHLIVCIEVHTWFPAIMRDLRGEDRDFDRHTSTIQAWLHSLLCLQMGELVKGHGDLELCDDGSDDGNDASNSISSASLRKRVAFRHCVAETMLTVLRDAHHEMEPVTRTRPPGLVCRHYMASVGAANSVPLRLAAWTLGELSPWYGQQITLRDSFEALLDCLPLRRQVLSQPGGATAMFTIFMAIAKLLVLYTHLRLSRQPTMVDSRDTSLRADLLVALKGALKCMLCSESVLVSQTASELQVLLELSLHQLQLAAKKAVKGQPPAVDPAACELFEELALPFSTCLQEEVDRSMAFLDDFVNEETKRMEREGRTVRRYIPKSQRADEPPPPSTAGLRHTVYVADEMQQGKAQVEEQVELLIPRTVKWSRQGFLPQQDPPSTPSSPRAPSPDPDDVLSPADPNPTPARRTHAWLHQAIALGSHDAPPLRVHTPPLATNAPAPADGSPPVYRDDVLVVRSRRWGPPSRPPPAPPTQAPPVQSPSEQGILSRRWGPSAAAASTTSNPLPASRPPVPPVPPLCVPPAPPSAAPRSSETSAGAADATTGTPRTKTAKRKKKTQPPGIRPVPQASAGYTPLTPHDGTDTPRTGTTSSMPSPVTSQTPRWPGEEEPPIMTSYAPLIRSRSQASSLSSSPRQSPLSFHEPQRAPCVQLQLQMISTMQAVQDRQRALLTMQREGSVSPRTISTKLLEVSSYLDEASQAMQMALQGDPAKEERLQGSLQLLQGYLRTALPQRTTPKEDPLYA